MKQRHSGGGLMEQFDVLRKRLGRVEVRGLPPLKAYPDMSLLWLLVVLAGPYHL